MNTNRIILGFTLSLFVSFTSSCGKGVKGAGAKSAAAAKSSASSQKVGTAKSETGSATNSGATSGGIPCDSAVEGLAFCATDTQIIFCDSGSWWALNCTAVESTAYCGQDQDTIDCYVAE